MRKPNKLVALIFAILASVAMLLPTSAYAANGTNNDNGSITINDAEPGHTYKAYQVLVLESYNEEKDAYAYKANADWAGWLETQTKYVSIDDQGYVTWVKDADAAAFAKDAIAHAKEAGINPADTQVAPAAATGSQYSIVKFENLNLGYYLVDTTLGTLCSLDTTIPNVEMFEKNEGPGSNKEVQEDDDQSWGGENTAQIGDTVEFRTTIAAKPGAVNYVLHDAMDEGLTLNVDSITVDGLNKGSDANSGDYHVVTTGLDDGCTFEVVFHRSFLDSITAERNLVVTYDAVLNENAKVYEIPNTNKTRLEYGNKTEPDYTPWTETKTYTFKFDIVKTDSDNQLLDGAEFELYTAQTSGDKIALVKESEGVYRLATAKEQAVDGFESAVIVAKDGRATVNGLDDKTTYWLEETKAPEGFNKLDGRIEVAFGKKVNISTTMTGNQWNEGDGGVHVVNHTGSLLPSTGGIGTTIFYALGGALVLGVIAVFLARKRAK